MGREGGGYGGVENENARKKPQNATDLAFGDAPWGYCPCVIHFWKALFRDKISIEIVCLYLEPFKSNRVSNRTIRTTFASQIVSRLEVIKLQRRIYIKCP